MAVKVRSVRVLASTGLADLTGATPFGALLPLAQSTPLAREIARLSRFDRRDRLYAYCFLHRRVAPARRRRDYTRGHAQGICFNRR